MTTVSGTIAIIGGDTAPAAGTITNELDIYGVSSALPSTAANTTFFVKDTAGGVAPLITGVLSVTAPDDTITVGGTTSAPTVARPALTGDISVPAGSNAATLPNLNGNVGTFQGITVNGKGQVTAASNQGYVNAAGAAAAAPVQSVTGTAPIASSGGANPAISIALATQAAAGAFAALDKLKLDNLWVDAQVVGITPANTGAANVTAFNAWYAAAPNAVTLYFAPGTYPFASELTNNRDIRVRYLGAGKGRSILQNTSATGNLINQTVAGFYISCEELGFSASVTKTAGTAITAGSNNAYFDIRRCEFTGQFRSIDYVGSGGNIGCINECLVTSPVAGGSQIRINGTGINMMMQNCTVNCAAVATVGVEVNQVGALQITGDYIGGTNALLINPGSGQVAASVFVVGAYFDNTLGSCVKITGAGAAVRNKFIGCSMTLAAGAASGSAAIECSTTVAAGSQGLDVQGCNILNTFGAASCNGILYNGAADYNIQNNNISGWATGLNLTPNPTAGSTLATIQNNRIGTAGGYGVNTTGILLNAGTAAYGALEIQNNDCAGNTTVLTNNLTTNIPTNASRYRITDNAGINPKGTVTTPAVGASGVAVTNTTGYRVQVFQKNGTTAPSVYTVNGVAVTTVANTVVTTGTNTFNLDPGGTIAFTYTAAPTMVWVAN